MSFLDKAKDKATQLTAQVKEKVDDQHHKKQADDLLDDVGRIIYRQRTTGTIDPGDDAAIDALVTELKALADLGVNVLEEKPAPEAAADAAPPPPPASKLPPPPPTS